MSKQFENYIGSQQHWEDRINDDYYYQKQMEKELQKQIEKQIYNNLQKPNTMVLLPKEEAKEFLSKFEHEICLTDAIECALIAVDKILFVLEFNLDFKMEKSIKYWQEVKEEILIIKND